MTRKPEPYGFSCDDRKKLDPGGKKDVLQLIAEIGTWYRISRPQQNLLIAAGRYLVDQHADTIRETLWGT